MKRIALSRVLSLFAAVVVFLVAAVAFGADAVAQPQSAAAQLLNYSIEIVGMVVLALVGVLVQRGSAYFTAKTKIQVPAQVDSLLAQWAERAVNFAEEKARKVVAANDAKMTGPAKLEAALAFGIDLARQYKLDAIAEQKLADYIHAHLGGTRAYDDAIVSATAVLNPQDSTAKG